MKKLRKMLRNYVQNERGVALIEFAFVLPILILITFPLIDYSRYILLQQKVIKASYVIGDAITMSQPIEVTTEAAQIDGSYMREELLNAAGDDLIDTIPTLMLPFRQQQGENLWQVVISHVIKPAGTGPQITWQYDEDSRSFNSVSTPSTVGTVSSFNSGTAATLPPILANGLEDGEDLIVVEVTATHIPITPALSALNIPFLGQRELNYTSFMRSRYGSLQYIWSVNCPPASTTCPGP